MGAAVIAEYPEWGRSYQYSVAFGMLRSRHHEISVGKPACGT